MPFCLIKSKSTTSLFLFVNQQPVNLLLTEARFHMDVHYFDNNAKIGKQTPFTIIYPILTPIPSCHLTNDLFYAKCNLPCTWCQKSICVIPSINKGWVWVAKLHMSAMYADCKQCLPPCYAMTICQCA